jgi:hypothetical protein
VPIGTLTKKIQCQPTVWVRTPPSTRPIEAPAAPTKLTARIALACSSGSAKRVTIMPRPTADTIAPPILWACGDQHAVSKISWDNRLDLPLGM